MDELREKVMKGLKCCAAMSGEQCAKCPYANECEEGESKFFAGSAHLAADALSLLKAQEPNKSKYEYHTDHTDCPWYISGEESKCPVTCSQYRDGWNDAMNYIFRNGDWYRPYDKIRKGR